MPLNHDTSVSQVNTSNCKCVDQGVGYLVEMFANLGQLAGIWFSIRGKSVVIYKYITVLLFCK